MTDAYIEGFCKTAEEHGVDPKQLCKRAGIGSVIGNWLTTANKLQSRRAQVQRAWGLIHDLNRAARNAAKKDLPTHYKNISKAVQDINAKLGTRISPQDVMHADYYYSPITSSPNLLDRIPNISHLGHMLDDARGQLIGHYLRGGVVGAAGAGTAIGGAYALGRGLSHATRNDK